MPSTSEELNDLKEHVEQGVVSKQVVRETSDDQRREVVSAPQQRTPEASRFSYEKALARIRSRIADLRAVAESSPRRLFLNLNVQAACVVETLLSNLEPQLRSFEDLDNLHGAPFPSLPEALFSHLEAEMFLAIGDQEAAQAASATVRRNLASFRDDPSVTAEVRVVYEHAFEQFSVAASVAIRSQQLLDELQTLDEIADSYAEELVHNRHKELDVWFSSDPTRRIWEWVSRHCDDELLQMKRFRLRLHLVDALRDEKLMAVTANGERVTCTIAAESLTQPDWFEPVLAERWMEEYASSPYRTLGEFIQTTKVRRYATTVPPKKRLKILKMGDIEFLRHVRKPDDDYGASEAA